MQKSSPNHFCPMKKENQENMSAINEENSTLVKSESQENTLNLGLHNDAPAKPRGVLRIERVKESLDSSKRGKSLKALLFVSVMICSWAAALDSSTTSNYAPYATSSYGHHSMLSTLEIATSIISAVSKPFLAKISDLTSRPTTYILVLFFYVVGYIIISASHTISAYVVGSAFVSVGSSGITLLNSIIIGDLTPLKYRGLIQGFCASPYIINVWFSGLIVEALAASNWRWGYGMFAIIMPVVTVPSICVMYYLDHQAQNQEEITSKLSPPQGSQSQKRVLQVIWSSFLEIDGLGLIILGFGWSLLLLPFSLYSTAKGEWKNPSLIAMLVVGGILLIAYVIYELKFAPFPSMPRRVVFNKTFITAVIIDFFYMIAAYIRILYLSSYAYVVTNWSIKNWTYYNNTLTMSICVFGIITGVVHRVTHRYKYAQIAGIAVAIIGQGIMIRHNSAAIDTASLVMVQILAGAGAAFSTIGSQVSSQASVPHQDMSLVISLLLLWSSIGGAIGAAIAAPIWSSKLPQYLREEMPASVNDTMIVEYFGSITLIDANPWGSEVRDGAIRAYQRVSYLLFSIGLGIYFIPLIASCFQSNYYLGDEQNAVEGVQDEAAASGGEVENAEGSCNNSKC